VLLTELLLRLNVPQFGYVFMRPMHLLALFTPPVLAWFVWRLTANRTVAVTLVAFIAIYIQIILLRVPHVSSLDDMNPSLIQRIRSADGGLVLVENSPHRDMDAAPATVSEPTPFGVHWEPLLPSATGRRFYAGFWDGWQWSPWRGQTLAGGTLFGQQIELIPIERFESEMRRWGVRRLFVWSAASVRYLNGHSQFERVWSAEPWHEFVYAAGDSREVITASHGTATLSHVTPLGATVQLDAVEAGEEVVVRTNHYPAWELRSDDARIPHYERNGQLAFRAPHRGRQTLELVYPRRLALTLLALAVWLMAVSWRKTGLGVRYDR